MPFLIHCKILEGPFNESFTHLGEQWSCDSARVNVILFWVIYKARKSRQSWREFYQSSARQVGKESSLGVGTNP